MINLKEKGFTLVELMVAMAILGILMTMVSPLFRNIISQSETTSKFDKIDKDLSRTGELIKRVVRASQGTSSELAIDIRLKSDNWLRDLSVLDAALPRTGEGVVVRISNGSRLSLYFDQASGRIFVNEGAVEKFTGGNTLLRNVSNVVFRTNERHSILVMDISVTIDGTTRTLTDVAISKVMLLW